MNKVRQIRNKLERVKGQYSQIEKSIKLLEKQIRENKRELHRHEQALEIVKEAGLKTQQQLQYHISDITSLALEAVFENPYKLEIEFVQRRNKTECDIYFMRDGNRINPLAASGGGAVDVASFALRIASWSMETPKTRNTIFADEPMRYLSSNYQEKASIMIQEISKKLGIQFIIITHEPILGLFADKIFEVSIKNGISKVN